MNQAKMSLEYLHIGLRNTVVGAAHSQNLFEHQQRQKKTIASFLRYRWENLDISHKRVFHY